MTPAEIQVLAVIRNSRSWCAGRIVAEICNLNCRQVRDVAHDLVVKYRQPIISKSGAAGGYKYSTDPKEIEESRAQLTALGTSILEKARALGNAKFSNQLELGL